MIQECSRPEDITEENIKEQFEISDEIRFSARPFNYIKYRYVWFGNLSWGVSLERFLTVIGITPQMLRTMFDPQRKFVKRCFPFNLSWFGFNKHQSKWKDISLPKHITTYEELGSFPLAEEAFQKLANILGKSIKVSREDGGTGEHYYLFTVHPSKKIIGDIKK